MKRLENEMDIVYEDDAAGGAISKSTSVIRNQLMKMKPAEFIALSACTMTLTALGIDIMLPAFGHLREQFSVHTQFW